jgi:hypothetical protein
LHRDCAVGRARRWRGGAHASIHFLQGTMDKCRVSPNVLSSAAMPRHAAH